MTMIQHIQQEIENLPEWAFDEILEFFSFIKFRDKQRAKALTQKADSSDGQKTNVFDKRPPCGAAKNVVIIKESFFDPLSENS